LPENTVQVTLLGIAYHIGVIEQHKRMAWGCRGCSRIPNAEKLPSIWAKFSTFGQSMQPHSHISEVVSIFPTKAN